VPGNEERRIDWCRRVKEYQPNVRIVLLLHRPSRQSVAQCFAAKADVILGVPCAEAQLSQRLSALLETPAAP
jgi:DNA-binding response OmpR family regulator